MLLCEHEAAIVNDQQRAQDASLVRVDEDVTVDHIVADGDLGSNAAAPAPALEVSNQLVWILVQPVDVPVHVHACALGPVLWFLDSRFREQFLDIILGHGLGDVDHLGGVLHQTAVLPFGRLVGAQSPPLSRVKVTSLEVRLAAHQRAGDAAHV